MFGFRTAEFAIDLGSSHIRIANLKQGLLVSEASRAVVYQQDKGERVVLAYGNLVLPMHGRIPKPLEEVLAIRDGAVWDRDCLREIIRSLMVLANQRLLWVNQQLVICLPSQANLVEKKNLQKIFKEAGGGKIRFVNRAMAAASALNIPFHEPHGHFIVDIGAHTTEMTILSCSDVVQNKLIKLGGEALSKGLVRHLRDKFKIEVSLQQAERLKEEFGSAVWIREDTGELIEVKGLSIETSFPDSLLIDRREIVEGLGAGLKLLVENIQAFLDEVPLELAGDIADVGIVLIGGGALLEGIDDAIRNYTNLPVIIPEEPKSLAVTGALMM